MPVPATITGASSCAANTSAARRAGLDSEGWYAVAGWRVARTLLPTVRYDTFLEDCSRGSSRQTNYTAGLTWQPVKYLRCQLDYTYEDFAARGVAGRNVVALMLSGIF